MKKILTLFFASVLLLGFTTTFAGENSEKPGPEIIKTLQDPGGGH